MNSKPDLPVDRVLPEILASLQRHPCLVLEAQPGAGKTTRVPPALLTSFPGETLVLEPRRIAARMAARRVAGELGELPGETVGYQVRFEQVAGPRTRLRFLTEGVFTRRLLGDPQLKGVSVVVLDEFHERHLESDLALALLQRLRRKRSDFRVVVMSATLDTAAVSRYLDNCPVLCAEGRIFDLAIRHLPYSPQPLEAQVRDAVETILKEERFGNILAFLPGAAEIRLALRACEPLTRRTGILALPLHGSLSPTEQDRAVSPTAERKLILATNVAESSITVEGVNAVIDSGLARQASWSAWSGLPTLEIRRISQASAAQRAGRAGRTGPGQVLRLYSSEDYHLRPAHDTPEILRSDLAQLCLALRGMNLDPAELQWLDAPPPESLAIASELLNRLGATADTARALAHYPLPPRLARFLDEAFANGAGQAACEAAAWLASGTNISGDLHAALDSPRDPRLAQTIAQLRRIQSHSHPARSMPKLARNSTEHDNVLLKSLLAGFPDRVARRRGNQALLSTGASAEFAGAPPSYEFMLALDAEDRTDKPFPLIRSTARIKPEWLLDLFPNHVHDRSAVLWNRTSERVEAVSALVYDELVIEESRHATPDPAASAALLTQRAIEAGIERFVDAESLDRLLARMEFAGLEPPVIEDELRHLCAGLLSFSELKAAAKNLIPLLEQRFATSRLRELAPDSIRLKAGRQVKIHYERGKTPWAASRLQDFFGMGETPRIGVSQTPLVLHLLAPNHRAVQTTTDLAGFWQRLYPQLRRELMRRYPKHAWPERP